MAKIKSKSKSESVAGSHAIDPICQKEVSIDTAKYKSDVEHRIVYFCCAGCQTKFDANPAAYPLSKTNVPQQTQNA